MVNKKTTSQNNPKAEKTIVLLAAAVLQEYTNRPYKVFSDADHAALTESIAANGILNPVLVRRCSAPTAEAGYIILSGHRRVAVAKELGIAEIPCIVIDCTDDEAVVLLCESNFQRESILPSEKAFAYKMRLEALQRLPGRHGILACSGDTDVSTTANTTGTAASDSSNQDTDSAAADDAAKLHGQKSRDVLASQSGDSATQVQRYLRLTHLIPELLAYVDAGKMAMRPATELSFVGEDIQQIVADCIYDLGEEIFPSHEQTIRIRKLADTGDATPDTITAIMAEEKPNQQARLRLSYKLDEIRDLIPSLNQHEAEKYVIKALRWYKKYLENKRGKESGTAEHTVKQGASLNSETNAASE